LKSNVKKREKQRSGFLRIVDVFHDVFDDADYADVPAWPPDAFCFAAAILHQSGAYTRVSSGLDLASDFKSRQAREKNIETTGKEWRTSKNAPPLVIKWWNTVRNASQLPLSSIVSHDALTAALINLLATADEACRGVGMSLREEDPFLTEAEFVLENCDNVTLCKAIHPTPNTSLSFRVISALFSQKLTYYWPHCKD